LFATWLFSALRQAGWAPASVYVVHVVAARGFRAYQRFPQFDVPMHLLGGVAIAYFFHTAALNGARLGCLAPYHRLTHLILVFGLTCAAALGWEFWEFLSDRYLGSHSLGDRNDTLLDLLLGVLGGVSFLIAATWLGNRDRRS